MSGSSWDYAYQKVEPIAARLLDEADPMRRALGSLLMQITHALHDIEWVDSGDYGRGDDFAAIVASLGGHQAAQDASLREVISKAEGFVRQIKELRAASPLTVNSDHE